MNHEAVLLNAEAAACSPLHIREAIGDPAVPPNGFAGSPGALLIPRGFEWCKSTTFLRSIQLRFTTVSHKRAVVDMDRKGGGASQKEFSVTSVTGRLHRAATHPTEAKTLVRRTL